MSRLQHLLHASLAELQQPKGTRELITRFGHRTRLGVCVVTGRRIAESFDKRNHFISRKPARRG